MPLLLFYSMKQYTTTLVFLLLAAYLFTSCHARVELKSGDPDTPQTNESTVAVTFATSIKSPITQLRADSDPNIPVVDNSKLPAIKDLRIVLYANDEEGHPTTVAYAFDRQLEILRGKATGDDLLSFDFDTGRLTVKHEEAIAVGNYSALFFLSPTTALKEATQVGKDFTELSKPILHDFSPKGDLSIIYSIYSNIDSPLQIREEDLAHASAHDAKLFRVEAPALKALTAMTYLKVDEGVQDEEYYIPQGASCIVFVDAQRTNFIPLAENVDITLDDQSVVSIPKCTPYSGLGQTKEELRQHFAYYDQEKGRVNRHRFKPGTDETDSWIIPIPENTLAGSDVHTYTATRLILKVPIIPKKIKDDFDQVWSEAQSRKLKDYGWLKVGEQYYTNKTFKAAYEAAMKQSRPSDVDKKIVAAGKELIAQAMKVNVSEVTTTAAMQFPKYNYRSENVVYYDQGLSYKVLPIRHFKDDQLAKRNSDGRYAVVRNTLYLYQIALSSIGSCTMDEYDRLVKYDSQVLPGDVSIGISKPSIIFTKQTL